jgi:hypothetical protein
MHQKWAVVLRLGVALLHIQDPLLPAFGLSDSVYPIRPTVVFYGGRAYANESNEVEVLGQLPYAVELSQYAQEDETLRVHVFSEEQVFAEVIQRKVILPNPHE